jgi:glycine C-acetyltransferase
MPDINLNPYTAESQAIAQRMRMAELLNQQAMQPLEMPQVAGARISPYAGLAKILQGYTAGVGQRKALEQQQALAEKYQALVMTDECHSTGFMGKTGRGVHEHRGVMGKIDIITGTLGKALGGASGGFTSGRKEMIELLRQRSRPYLFSNTLAPSITGASIAVLELLSETTELRDRLEKNTRYFREKMEAAGFDIKPGEHAIVPIMLYDAVLSQKMAEKLLERGIYVIGFYYPVVPKGQARIRVQISAGHQQEHLDQAIAAFIAVGKELG